MIYLDSIAQNPTHPVAPHILQVCLLPQDSVKFNFLWNTELRDHGTVSVIYDGTVFKDCKIHRTWDPTTQCLKILHGLPKDPK
jgi:hypothetical protein